MSGKLFGLEQARSIQRVHRGGSRSASGHRIGWQRLGIIARDIEIDDGKQNVTYFNRDTAAQERIARQRKAAAMAEALKKMRGLK